MKSKLLIAAFFIVGISLLVGPYLFSLFQNPSFTAKMSEGVKQVSTNLTYGFDLDKLIDYTQKIVGLIAIIIGTIKSAQELKKASPKKRVKKDGKKST